MAELFDIQVDAAVFETLKRHAEPLVDDANSVLRRLLGLEEDPTTSPTPVVRRSATSQRPRLSGKNRERRAHARARTGELLPLDDYFEPIIESLDRRGGKALAEEIMADVERALRGRFTSADKQRLKGGRLRWRTRVQFARLELVKRGRIVGNSPRGVWELSKTGGA